MITRKNAALVFLFAIMLPGGSVAGADPGCPFLEPVAPLTLKDSVPEGRAFVSLGWVARDFSVTIRSVDTAEKCVFDLDRHVAGNKAVRTVLFSFKPGKYRVSYLRHHDPGTHSNIAWVESDIDIKNGTWNIVRFREESVESTGKSIANLSRAKTWRLSVKSDTKARVIKHASGEQPGAKTIVLVGILLTTLLFGGLMLYAR